MFCSSSREKDCAILRTHVYISVYISASRKRRAYFCFVMMKFRAEENLSWIISHEEMKREEREKKQVGRARNARFGGESAGSFDIFVPKLN